MTFSTIKENWIRIKSFTNQFQKFILNEKLKKKFIKILKLDSGNKYIFSLLIGMIIDIIEKESFETK